MQTRSHAFLGCLAFTGRRFWLFRPISFATFGEGLRESDRFTVVGDRYIGVVRTFDGDREYMRPGRGTRGREVV